VYLPPTTLIKPGALRRTSYAVDPVTKLFTEETAQIFGVPFELIPFKVEGGKPQPPSPPANHVYAEQPRAEYEIEFPVRPAATDAGYGAGVGDVVVSGKYVLSFNPSKRRILSGGFEVALPTGSEQKELGSGTTVFVPFLAFGKGIGSTVFQTKLSAELPADTNRAARTFKYAVGYSLPPIGFSRTGYIAALELVGAYNWENKSHEQTAVIGVSKALNKLGHVIASVGLGIPLRPSEGPKPKQFRAYLLWDFGDGPIWTGW